MVPLTRLNGGGLHLNADLIATVEEHHDTVVTLMDGRCLVVSETAEQVVASVLRYRAEVLALADQLLADPTRLAHLREARNPDDTATAQILPLRPSTGGE